jgi:hypothetical protein
MVFSEALSSLTIKIKIKTICWRCHYMRNALCLGTVLASFLLFSGCSSTEVTQDYQPRISMTKSEAIEVVRKHVESVRMSGYGAVTQSSSVDTNGIRATFSIYKSPPPGFRWVYYPGDDIRTFFLPFADVVRIATAGNVVALSKTGQQFVMMRSSFCFNVKKSDSDEFISALLTLCPNVGNGSRIDAVLIAVKQGDINKVKSMLDANPELVNIQDSSGATLLRIAVKNGHNEVADLLRQHGGVE